MNRTANKQQTVHITKSTNSFRLGHTGRQLLHDKVEYLSVRNAVSITCGKILVIDFKVINKLSTKEMKSLKSTIETSFKCRIYDIINETNFIKVYIRTCDVEANNCIFSNPSNIDKANPSNVDMENKAKAGKSRNNPSRKAYNAKRAQMRLDRLNQSSNGNLRQSIDTGKPSIYKSSESKWSLSTPSESVRSVRSLWDSIERLASPNGMTASEAESENRLNNLFSKVENLVKDSSKHLESKISSISEDLNKYLDNKISILSGPLNVQSSRITSVESSLAETQHQIMELFSDIKAVKQMLSAHHGSSDEQQSEKRVSSKTSQKDNTSDKRIQNQKKKSSRPQKVLSREESTRRRLYDNLERNMHVIKDEPTMDALLEAAKNANAKEFYAIIERNGIIVCRDE